ncbi:MAG: hypothetical protein ACTSV1_08485 [Alphaproteobacteria bacterium]
MYTLTKELNAREFLTREGVNLIIALAIANFFYKFGSFLPEALAFLVTWYGLSWFVDKILPSGKGGPGS